LRRGRPEMPAPAGELRELLQFPLADDGGRLEMRPRLRHLTDDLIPERRDEPRELFERRLEFEVLDARIMNGDENGFRTLRRDQGTAQTTPSRPSHASRERDRALRTF